MILFITDIIESISSFLDYKDLISLNYTNSNIKLNIYDIMIEQKNLKYIKLFLIKHSITDGKNLLSKCNDINFSKDFLSIYTFSQRIDLFKKTFINNSNYITKNNIKTYCLNSISYKQFNIYSFIISQFNSNDINIINNFIIYILISQNNHIILNLFLEYLNNNKHVYRIQSEKFIDICINNEYEECLDILIQYNYPIINNHLYNAITNSNTSIIKKILLYTDPLADKFKALKINNNRDISKILWKDKRVQLYIKNGKKDILQYLI